MEAHGQGSRRAGPLAQRLGAAQPSQVPAWGALQQGARRGEGCGWRGPAALQVSLLAGKQPDCALPGSGDQLSRF